MNNINSNKKELSPEQHGVLVGELKSRFEKNMNRHKNLEWAKVQAKLEANPEKLWSLGEMERTGGEPDVAGFDEKTGEHILYECGTLVISFRLERKVSLAVGMSRVETGYTQAKR